MAATSGQLGLGIFGPPSVTLQTFYNQLNVVYVGVQSFDLMHLKNLDNLIVQFTNLYKSIIKDWNAITNIHTPAAINTMNTAVAANATSSIKACGKQIAQLIAEFKYFTQCVTLITKIITIILSIITLIGLKIVELAASLILLAEQAVAALLKDLMTMLTKWIQEIKKQVVTWIQVTIGTMQVSFLVSDMITNNNNFNQRLKALNTSNFYQEQTTGIIQNIESDILLNQYMVAYNEDLCTLLEMSDNSVYGVQITQIIDQQLFNASPAPPFGFDLANTPSLELSSTTPLSSTTSSTTPLSSTTSSTTPSSTTPLSSTTSSTTPSSTTTSNNVSSAVKKVVNRAKSTAPNAASLIATPGFKQTVADVVNPANTSDTNKQILQTAATAVVTSAQAPIQSITNNLTQLGMLRNKINNGTNTPAEKEMYDNMKKTLSAAVASINTLSQVDPAQQQTIRDSLLATKLNTLKNGQAGALQFVNFSDWLDFILRTQGLNPYERLRQCDLDFISLLADAASENTTLTDFLAALKKRLTDALAL